METIRQNKISKLIQKELSEIIQSTHHTFPTGALITVTNVNISPDLSLARVHVSIFCPGKKVDDMLTLINENKKNIRFQLGVKIKNQVRRIPELAFFIDDTLDQMERIENLLKK